MLSLLIIGLILTILGSHQLMIANIKAKFKVTSTAYYENERPQTKYKIRNTIRIKHFSRQDQPPSYTANVLNLVSYFLCTLFLSTVYNAQKSTKPNLSTSFPPLATVQGRRFEGLNNWKTTTTIEREENSHLPGRHIGLGHISGSLLPSTSRGQAGYSDVVCCSAHTTLNH